MLPGRGLSPIFSCSRAIRFINVMGLRVDVSVDTKWCVLLPSDSESAKITKRELYPRAGAWGVLKSIELLVNGWNECCSLSSTGLPLMLNTSTIQN